jgi:GNAT superfamily N-acetyltransferase
MSTIDVRPVRTKREKRLFLTFPWRIYRSDPLWVPPLLPERRKVIDPAKGAFLQHGRADFFIAWRDGKPVGTICAGEDFDANASRGKDECVFGFFEYIEDYDVFCALLDKAAEWGRDHGLRRFFGPFNLDYEDGYGVLISGRDRPPALLCGHTPIYYQGFMERYGFEPARAFNVAYALDIVDNPALSRIESPARRFRSRESLTIRGADLSRWDAEIDNVHKLLNLVLTGPDGIPWAREAVEAIFSPFREIADPDLVLFAEVGGEVVGMFAAVPNLNEVFIHTNGLRYPWNYAELLIRLRNPKIECLALKSVLIMPDHQETGIGVVLMDELVRRAREKGYTWIDFSITSADNAHNTPGMSEKIGAELYKQWQVYTHPI